MNESLIVDVSGSAIFVGHMEHSGERAFVVLSDPLLPSMRVLVRIPFESPNCPRILQHGGVA